MRYLFVLIAVLVGIALIIKLGTGTLDTGQVAGVGILLLALAIVSPADFPGYPRV